MSWRRWSVEKAARRRARAEVFAAESWREEYREARAAAKGRASVPPWLYRLLFMGFLVMMAVISNVITVEYVVAVTLVWTLGTIFSQASHFYAGLYDDTGLIVYDYLPISDGEIFRAQCRRFLRGAWWPLFDFALAYSVLLAHAGLGWRALTSGLAFGAAQWVFIMAMAVSLVAFARPHWFTTLALPFQVATLVLLSAGLNLSSVCAWLNGLAWCVPPLGWILQSLGVSESSGTLRRVVPGLMGAVALALSPIAFARARQAFLLSEPRHTSDGRIPELLEFGERLAKSPAEARAAIEGRQFLAGFDWQKAGWLERRFSGLLNARERTVAEFMLAANPGWTLQLRRLWPLLLLALPAPWLFRHRWLPQAEVFLPLCGLMGVAALVRSARGFELPPGGAPRSPYYANYPIAFWELTRVVLKINLASTLAVTACVLILYGASAGMGSAAIGNALKWMAVALMVQPLLVIGAFSPRTNDAQKRGFAWCAFGLTLVMAGAAITFFMAAKWWVVALAGGLAAGASVLALVLYGGSFNRSRFDLVPMRRTEED